MWLFYNIKWRINTKKILFFSHQLIIVFLLLGQCKSHWGEYTSASQNASLFLLSPRILRTYGHIGHCLPKLWLTFFPMSLKIAAGFLGFLHVITFTFSSITSSQACTFSNITWLYCCTLWPWVSKGYLGKVALTLGPYVCCHLLQLKVLCTHSGSSTTSYIINTEAYYAGSRKLRFWTLVNHHCLQLLTHCTVGLLAESPTHRKYFFHSIAEFYKAPYRA